MGKTVTARSTAALGMALIALIVFGGCSSESVNASDNTTTHTETMSQEDRPTIRVSDDSHRPECRNSESVTLSESASRNTAATIMSAWHQTFIELKATDDFYLVGAIARNGELSGFKNTGRDVHTGDPINLQAAEFTPTPDYTKAIEVFDDVTLCVIRK